MPDSVAFDLAGKRVWVAGHDGMVGSAVVRRLAREHCDVVIADRRALDLTRQAETEAWLDHVRPDVVILAAARVGGILANDTRPVAFLRDNIQIATNVIDAAHRAGVEKLLFLGSSCVYPRLAAQPIQESALLTGPLEPTNQWYAIAKIAGIKLTQSFRIEYGCDYISAMPTNLYGPHDNFDLAESHVLPALMRKAHDAKIAGSPAMTVWGTGTPRREFLHVDDCADALVFLLKSYSGVEPVNVGSGGDLAIAELARKVAATVGYDGEILFDASKPDGTPRKLMDVRKITGLGWEPQISLPEGLRDVYLWFLENVAPSSVSSTHVVQ